MIRLGGPLLVLIGAPGSGKSAWARRHFTGTQRLSADQFRALAADDPGDQRANPYAWDALHTILRGRMELGRPTVVDATNADPAPRKELLRHAHAWSIRAFAVVFVTPLPTCLARNARRPENVRVPEGFVRDVHAQVLAEFPVETTWTPPGGFSAGLWVVRGVGRFVGGFVREEYQAASWLDGARTDTGLGFRRSGWDIKREVTR